MARQKADSSDSFSVRLDLALKALNVSRVKLAATVGVHKSLVSRWLSGEVIPSSHNLSRISEALAKSLPGFNTVAWERTRPEFEALLGVSSARPSESTALSGLLALSQQVSAQETRFNGHVYPGHYVQFRQRFANTGQVYADIVSIWLEGGRLRALMGDGGYRLSAEGLVMRGKLFLVGEGTEGNHGMNLLILNGTGEKRAMVLDGLLCANAGDRFFTPTAAKVVLLRIADSAGDERSDTALFNEIAGRLAPLTNKGRADTLLPERFRAAIDNRTEGDAVLRVPEAASVAYSDIAAGRYDWPAPELATLLAS